MISATELRRGAVIKFEGALYIVVDVMHTTPGNLRSIIQCKLKNMATDSTVEKRFSSGDKLEDVYIEQQDLEYLYLDGDNLVFMNQENYEQMNIAKEFVGESFGYLKENTIVKVNFCEGKPIGVQLPAVVELKVAQTEPQLKGATITNVYKPAEMETGIMVQVPPFIGIGELIRVDTRDGKYVERVNK